jgi:cytochrome c-type biogenesis protein CcmH/NrfG
VLLLRGKKEDLPEARELAEKAVAQAPGAAGFHDTLARIHADSGRRELALAEFRNALSLDPQNLDAMVGLADELVRSGTKESRAEAKRLLEQVARVVEKPDAPPLAAPLRKQLDAAKAALDAVGDGR